jgi:hypothetical protein
MQKLKKMKTKILLLAIAFQVSACAFGQMIVNTCQEQVLTHNYNNSSSWTQTGTSTSIAGGTFNFNYTNGGVYSRQRRSSGLNSLSSKYFIAACKFKPTGGNGPGHHILTLSSSSIDPVSYDAANSYAPTNNDAIIVDLTSLYLAETSISAKKPTSYSNPWQYRLRFKIGTTLITCAQAINSLALNKPTYIRLERGGSNGNDLKLSIYSDPSYTLHIAGSPIFWCNLPLDSIKPLKFVNHGVYTYANPIRALSGKIDSLRICSATDVEFCPACDDLIVDTGPDIYSCCPPPEIQLNGTVVGGMPTSINWSPTNALYNPTILNPTAAAAGTFILAITNNCNQTFTDTVTVTFNGEDDASCCRFGGTAVKSSAFPNPFSDNFSIIIPEEKIATVFVSNLYGVVFETKINVSGAIQLGNNLKQGTYSITIVYADGSKELINAIKL